MTDVKRLLRPLRPVLLPARDRLLDLQDRTYQLRFRSSPIRPVRKAEFDRAAGSHTYHAGRWGYTSVAGKLAGELILRHQLRSALELGARSRPLIVGADVMDVQDRPEIDTPRMIVHDATVSPWPIGDKAYDLFVALQVFEHLGDRQAEAFAEVRRIARHAVISLPIDWDVAPDNAHFGITHERALSWFHPVVPTRVAVGNPAPNKRLIYVFESLEAAAAAE
jgi:hypothetical protein